MGKIFGFIVKHIALIASIVVSAVITMGLGPILTGAMGAFWGTVATGAVAGFASGVIMTGSLKGGLAGALWGAVAAGFAYGGAELAGRLAGVGSKTAHLASLLKTGLTKLTAIKTLIHGLSSGIISYFRGGSFRAGFFSGLGSAFDIGTKGYGKMVGRTSIMAIIGGTFAKLGGGKFANGALSAAFTHLFNGELYYKITERIMRGYSWWKKIAANLGLLSDTAIEIELVKIYKEDMDNMNRWLSVHSGLDKGYYDILQRSLDLPIEAEFVVDIYRTTGVIIHKNKKGEWVTLK